mgnify:CR=1 FL=1
MTPIRDIMYASPVMPVIVLEDIAHAVPLAQALVAGGIRVLEVTLRTPVALDCVRAIRGAVPEAIVGVGTITSAADLDAAGLDPATEWLPVAPAAHHQCGGIITDLNGATSMPGLWAAGDYLAGPYPATLEGAVRSGRQAAQRLCDMKSPST